VEKLDRDIKDVAKEFKNTALTEVQAALYFWASGDETEKMLNTSAEFLDWWNHKTILFAEKLQFINAILPHLFPTPAKTIKRTITQSLRLLREEKKIVESWTVTIETPIVRKWNSYCSDEIAVTKTRFFFVTNQTQQYPVLAAVVHRVLGIPSSTEHFFL